MTGPTTSAPGYREMPAPKALRDIVACLWIRAIDSEEDVRIVPDGCADVVWQRGRGVTIAGPDTDAKIVSCTRDDLLVGIRFLPGAGGAALGLPLDELRNLRVAAADVERAFVVDPDCEPPDVVERFISAAADREADPLVSEAARRIERFDVRTIARELWVSERQLRRRFNSAVGYGPRTLARVLRFHRFVEAVDGGRTDLAALALDSGYADQAHLTRETTRLAGLSPLALIRARTSNGRAARAAT